MARAKFTDEEFKHLFEKYGGERMAREAGISIRQIYRRRRKIEENNRTPIEAPHSEKAIVPRISEYPGWVGLEVQNGVVLVGSDAHIWPGKPSTGMRAFIKFAKELKPKAVILNGDGLDFPRISRHAPIGWNDTPTVVDEIEAAQDQIGQIEAAAGRARKIWPLGNHDCLINDTQALTKRGWLSHEDISLDDEILSLSDGKAVWSKIDKIVSFPYEGDLVKIEKTRMSMAVTPNHRVLLRKMNWRSGRYDIEEYRKAGDLPSSFDIPTAADSDNVGCNLSDDQISLAGWLLTDGGIGQYNVSFYQSKPEGITEITGLLDRLGLKYSSYERQRGMRAICGRALLKEPLTAWNFLVHAEDSRKILQWIPEKGRLPDWCHDLDSRQFQVLLDAIVAGDGCWDGYTPAGKTCCVIYGTESILSSIQATSVRHGWRSRLAIDNRGDYRLCLAKEPKIRVEKKEVYKEPYKGDVWCLKVPYGNFMVRRSGCAYFTGNSRFETNLATKAPEYAKVHGTALTDHFALWQPCWACQINDDVVVKHRYSGGVHATYNNTLKSGKTTVTGHLHKLEVIPYTDYNGTRYGVGTGCLADVRSRAFLDYTEANPLNWKAGFIVLTFKDGILLWPEIVSVVDDTHVQFRGEIIRV